MPVFLKIDHIHVYVLDRVAAEKWYHEVLGFERVQSLESWFTEDGPLVLANGGVHIALFASDGPKNPTIAFAVDANNYRKWKQRLSEKNIQFRESDHELAWSIYFADPYGNSYEITTYEV